MASPYRRIAGTTTEKKAAPTVSRQEEKRAVVEARDSLVSALETFVDVCAKSSFEISEIATALPDIFTNRILIAQSVAMRRARLEAGRL